MNLISFRKANENDVSSLRMLARNSEAIWGFSESFLRIFDDEYNVTIDFVTSHPAVKFYIKCGAVLNGMSYSSIDGRDIPKLYFEFK